MQFQHEGNSLKSGIYKITNTKNNRIYIGSSKEFRERWKRHATSLRSNKHKNRFLQADFNKCGEDVFIFEIIEITDGKTIEERLQIEEVYINQYFDNGDRCYNLCKKAISREGRSSRDPEKIKKQMSEKAKNMWSDPEKVISIKKAMKEALSDPEIKERTKQVQKQSWENNKERRNSASERMKIRMNNNSEETLNSIEILRKFQPKGRETFKKRIKEDLEFRQAFIEDGQKKVALMNERYKTDPEYKKMMDEKSIENIEKYNEEKLKNMPYKTPLISSDGVIYSEIKSLGIFAKEHNLSESSLYKLYKGKVKQTKGWRLYFPS